MRETVTTDGVETIVTDEIAVSASAGATTLTVRDSVTNNGIVVHNPGMPTQRIGVLRAPFEDMDVEVYLTIVRKPFEGTS